MHESPPPEIDQAIDTEREWQELLGFSNEEKNNLDNHIWVHARVILAMASEIDRLEQELKDIKRYG